MLIGTAVCGKPHVRWCERAGEIKTSPPYSILKIIGLLQRIFAKKPRLLSFHNDVVQVFYEYRETDKTLS